MGKDGQRIVYKSNIRKTQANKHHLWRFLKCKNPSFKASHDDLPLSCTEAGMELIAFIICAHLAFMMFHDVSR